MLELAILGFLKEQPMHGYELKQRLTFLTGHVRPVSDGSLYPAISRLEKQGLLVKQVESSPTGMVRQSMSLTTKGETRLFEKLREPSDVDISDRNRYFIVLSFLKYLPKEDQLIVLNRRLEFLERGKSFFSTGGRPVKISEEQDLFRRGMLQIARETSRVERAWLRDMVKQLAQIEE